MVACQTCTVNMAVAERTKNRQGVSGNWHTDCEYLEHQRDNGPPATQPHLAAAIAVSLNKLINRKISAAARPTVAPGGAAAVGAGLSVGDYQYMYTSVSADGESLPSPASATITTTGPNSKINVTGILAGVAGTTSRRLYRTVVGATGPFLFCTAIAGNVTTTFADTVADVALGAKVPEFTTWKAGEFP
jgi:hypothetical protein